LIAGLQLTAAESPSRAKALPMNPLTPSLSPTGGEGVGRPSEGASAGSSAQGATKVRGILPSTLQIATFDVDATPPIGSLMAYDPVTNRWDLGLRARGIVLLGAGEPIVLCAVDWIGIANEGHDAFRTALARSAGTSPR